MGLRKRIIQREGFAGELLRYREGLPARRLTSYRARPVTVAQSIPRQRVVGLKLDSFFEVFFAPLGITGEPVVTPMQVSVGKSSKESNPDPSLTAIWRCQFEDQSSMRSNRIKTGEK